jgi:hypothetical protein
MILDTAQPRTPFTRGVDLEGYQGYPDQVTDDQQLALHLPRACLKLAAFPEVLSALSELGDEEATDMCFASKLGVRKWELSMTEAVASLGQAPVFFPKTDLERVQNL